MNGPYLDALAATRVAGNVAVTLDWARVQPIVDTTGCVGFPCNGNDFDLYVKTPDGNYIGYGLGALTTPPYVKSARDSFEGYEPLETVVIAAAAPNGIYRVFVDNWLVGSTWGSDTYEGSKASVQMYNGPGPIGTYYGAPPATCLTNEYWNVGYLTKTGTAYTWTSVNTCSNTAP